MVFPTYLASLLLQAGIHAFVGVSVIFVFPAVISILL